MATVGRFPLYPLGTKLLEMTRTSGSCLSFPKVEIRTNKSYYITHSQTDNKNQSQRLLSAYYISRHSAKTSLMLTPVTLKITPGDGQAHALLSQVRKLSFKGPIYILNI